jgi:hypothetical protein
MDHRGFPPDDELYIACSRAWYAMQELHVRAHYARGVNVTTILDKTNQTEKYNPAQHLGATNGQWNDGDFNGDGSTDLLDFNLLAANFGLSARAEGVTPQDWAALAAHIPEPASACAYSILAFLLRRVRSRRADVVHLL